MAGRIWRLALRILWPLRGAEDAQGWANLIQLIPGAALLLGLIAGAISKLMGSPFAFIVYVLAGLLALTLIAAYRLLARIEAYEERPRPNIVFDGFDRVDFQQQERVRLAESDGRPAFIRESNRLAEFYIARFTNQPSKIGEGAKATDVCARVIFFDESGNEVLEVRDARWADLPELQEMREDVKCIDLPASGASGRLNLVTRDLEETVCYGWDNHGSVGSGLPPGKYAVRVRITASNDGAEAKDFWFMIENAAFTLLVSEREGFENDCSTEWAAKKLATCAPERQPEPAP